MRGSKIKFDGADPDEVGALNRLSQNDPSERDLTLAEKWGVREKVCLRLADEYGLPLKRQNIINEQKSGGFLDEREDMQEVLGRVKSGRWKYLITPNWDRVSRGDKRDEAIIENTFIEAGLILVTDEGVTDFGDEDYDPTFNEIKSTLARSERRKGIQKRRSYDRARLSQNKRSQGAPPWCYKKVGRNVYDIWDNRFAVAEELFARIWTDPIRTICRDLNARAVPSPYSWRWDKKVLKALHQDKDVALQEVATQLNAADIMGGQWTVETLRRFSEIDGLTGGPRDSDVRLNPDQIDFCRACIAADLLTPYPMAWKPQTIREILRNPFFAGRISKRKKAPGGRKVQKLKVSEYETAEQDGGWKTVLSYGKWLTLQDQIGEIGQMAAPARSGLVTGILHCPSGFPMCLDGANTYACPCKYDYKAALCAKAGRSKFHGYAGDVVLGVLRALPLDALFWFEETPVAADIGQLQRQHADACRQLAEAERKSQGLMLNREEHIDLYGEEQYKAAAREQRVKVEDGRREVDRLARLMKQPDLSKVKPLLEAVREIGVETLWGIEDFDLRRSAIEGIIERIDLEPRAEGERFFTRARVTYQGWVRELLPDLQPPPLLKRRPRK